MWMLNKIPSECVFLCRVVAIPILCVIVSSQIMNGQRSCIISDWWLISFARISISIHFSNGRGNFRSKKYKENYSKRKVEGKKRKKFLTWAINQEKKNENYGRKSWLLLLPPAQRRICVGPNSIPSLSIIYWCVAWNDENMLGEYQIPFYKFM